jgi:hypothetical protein
LEELIMPPASGAALREGWQCLSWDTVRPRVPEHPRADRECHDHDTAEHHPGERRERAKHQQEAEAEFDARDDHGIDARKRDSRSLERLPHGVSPIRRSSLPPPESTKSRPTASRAIRIPIHSTDAGPSGASIQRDQMRVAAFVLIVHRVRSQVR